MSSSTAPTTGQLAGEAPLPSLNNVRNCQQTRANIGNNVMDSTQLVQQPVKQDKHLNTSFFWPNEYVHRAGAPDVTFYRLTIAELVTGCIRAALESDIHDTEKSARLTDVTELMVLSEQYKWDKVRAMYKEYLTMIQQGRSSTYPYAEPRDTEPQGICDPSDPGSTGYATVKDLKSNVLRVSEIYASPAPRQNNRHQKILEKNGVV